ncbi:hypothetical protein [Thermosipho sp. (in: thermotogales)]|jgi:hypothetical protein|uniref:hypothetical protein n=1 Tax=Thermosipho sp. (in: thermotogales) TaxID=1968895 RepID=UPI002580A476|nr:hypothetical protein [Thermosipho sp. (in: thermotogales)]MBZ4649280.1 hypothetical protein [Thermosipho sp. (in: thermotogales)]
MALLIFEGLDKTGKTTLKNEVLKVTNKHICWDRGPASQWVYGQLYNKPDTPDINELYKLEKSISNAYPVFYVYTYSRLSDIKDRMKLCNESQFLIDKIYETLDYYLTYFMYSPIPKIYVFTGFPIDKCVSKILEEVSFNETCKKTNLN